MFRNKFLRALFFLIIFLLRYSVGKAQIPVIISPDSASNYDESNPLLICKDTLLLRGVNLSSTTGNKSWRIISGNAVLVLPINTDSVYVIFKTSDVVGIEWKIRNNTTSTYIKNQKPTPPNAGKDTAICQNNLKLYANDPAIGKGKWISPSKDITFSDSTLNTAIVKNLPLGVTKLIWQTSSVCDTLQDEVEINNQSIMPSVVQVGNKDTTCTDTTSLFAKILPNDYTGKWYNELNVELGTEEVVHGVELRKSGGINIFKWEVKNPANCTAFDYDTVVYSIPTQANIVLPTQDTTVCNNQIELRGKNKGGTWLIKGNLTSIDTGRTLKINLLLPGNNVFYRIYKDPICNESMDSVLVINKSVDPPFIGPDTIVCGDSVVLKTDSQLSGFWTNIDKNQQIGTSTIAKVGSSIADTISYSWTSLGHGSICTASDARTIIYRKIQRAEITFPQKDTTVCADTIILKALGNGVWSRQNPSFSSTQNELTNHRLTSDANVFYWAVNDIICGNTLDSILVINKTVPKPDVGSDKISCSITSTLIANDAISSGKWYKLIGDSLIGNTVRIDINGLVPGENKYYRKSDNGFCSESDTVNVFYQEIIEAKISVPANADTVVCKDQISLVGKGVGRWTSKNISFLPSSSATISPKLKSDSNVFYWTVTDTVCGKAIDSVRVINKSVSKPTVVLDSCFVGIPSQSLLLQPKSIIPSTNGVWSVLASSPSGIALVNDTSIQSATFQPNRVGQYKFKFKVLNATCADSANTTYRILTKAQLAKDTCILKKRGELAVVGMRNNFPANIGRGEKGVWSRLDTNAIIGFDSAKVDLGFQALRGVFNFVYTISDTCRTCTKMCSSKDTITVTINNRANIIDSIVSNPNVCIIEPNYTRLKVNRLYRTSTLSETGTWSSRSGGLVFQNNVPQHTVADTTFSVRNLSIGKDTLYWTVKHVNGCPATTDSVFISRLTAPKAEVDKICYPSDAPNMRDTLTGNVPKAAANETGFWRADNNLASDNKVIGNLIVKSNPRGLYQARWVISSPLCTGFADTVRIKFISNPKVAIDTFFKVPFSGIRPVLSGNTVQPELGRWLNSENDTISKTRQLVIPDSLQGIYKYTYQVFDPVFNCSVDSNSKVTLITDPKIIRNSCVKGAQRTSLEAEYKFSPSAEKSIWEADTNMYNVSAAPQINNSNIFNVEFPKNNTIPIAGRLWVKHKIQSGKYTLVDSILLTNLTKPSILANMKTCTDTNIVLSPSANFQKQPYEKAFWTKKDPMTTVLLKGNSSLDTARKLVSGQHMFRFVVQDSSNLSCFDMDSASVTKVTKAKAGLDFTTCLTDTFKVLNSNSYASVERGKWVILSVFNPISKPIFLSDTANKTTVHGLGNRNTRIGWTIKNKKDSTCASTDSLRLVVVTKTKAIPKDTCVEFSEKAINLKGNRSASYEIARWSMLDGKRLANSQNLPYTPDSAGYKKLAYTIIDSTNNYRCAISDTATLRLVPKASIIAPNTCIVLSKGQTKADTLKVNVFQNVNGLAYRFNGKTIAGLPNTNQAISYDSAKVYINKWEIVLGGNCISLALDTTTLISKASAGTDTCLISSDTISLKGNRPQPLSKEFGKWSVLQGSAKFSDSTNYNSKVTFNKKGLTTLVWKIQNGSCSDPDSIKVNSISKALAQTPIPSCLKDIDSVRLQGNIISQNEKSIWQILAFTKDTILKTSSGKVKVAFGVNRFKYTIYDPQYPTCSDSSKVSVSVLKKPEIDTNPACNNYTPTDMGNVSVGLEGKLTITGLTYQWKKENTLPGDTILQENSNSKLQYNRIGKRTLWLKSFVTQDPTCSDSVLKTVSVVSKVMFPFDDTCTTSSAFRLVPSMYPDFSTGEYMRARVGTSQFVIKQPSDSIYGYPKGKNKVEFTVFDSDDFCSVMLDKSPFAINYISKARPLDTTVCRYFDPKLEEMLVSPQTLSATEQGAWHSDSIKIDIKNIATGFQKGKNVLKWVISSRLDSTCTSDSTVNYYTLTPSGFKAKNIYTCVTDTILEALKPSSNETVRWLPNNGFSTDSSILLQNLSNDIADTVIRTISLGATCPLSDTVIVLNRQLDNAVLDTYTIENVSIDNSDYFTCNSSITFKFPIKDDLLSAVSSAIGFDQPSNGIASLIPQNPDKYQYINMTESGKYNFKFSFRNSVGNCPAIKREIEIVKRSVLGIPQIFNDTVCNGNIFEFKVRNIGTPDKNATATWQNNSGAEVIVNNNDPFNIDSTKAKIANLYQLNTFIYKYAKEGCEGTVTFNVYNTKLTPDVSVLSNSAIYGCDSSSYLLKAKKPVMLPLDTSIFKYGWLPSVQNKLAKSQRDTVFRVSNVRYNIPTKFYFVAKNGKCPMKVDSINITNYQNIDSISAGINDTICATKINLQGFRSQTFAKGTWSNISNGTTIALGEQSRLTASLTSNNLNQFQWKVTNGVCEKNDTLEILVGDSIATAIVAEKLVTDCGTGKVLLKGNDPSLNGGVGFWWTNTNDTLSKHNEFDYTFNPKSYRDTLQFFYTIKNKYCSTTDTTAVYYFQTPSIAKAGEDQTLVKKQTLMSANQPEVGIGTWILKNGTGVIEGINNPNTSITDLVFGDNVFIWRISNGATCPVSEDEVILAFSDFDIPQAFSPNGDGKNDRFEIVGLENYSGSKLKVLNRWGREVYTSDDYQNNWDGASLEEDTYFFLLEIPGVELKKGYVVIKRK